MAEEDRFVELDHDPDGTEVFSLQEVDNSNGSKEEGSESKTTEPANTGTPKK